MLAELSQRGIIGDNPEGWYNKGVTASITYYGQIATDSQILDYYLEPNLGVPVTAPTQTEIDNYLAMPAVKYDAAKGLDQIASQSYINFFREPNEVWALLKRTGMPNTTTTLMLEKLLYNGSELMIPRRAPRNLPPETDINFENINAAFTEMETNPNYGSGPADISGRVWWDVK
jgi:hypothetical protein